MDTSSDSASSSSEDVKSIASTASPTSMRRTGRMTDDDEEELQFAFSEGEEEDERTRLDDVSDLVADHVAARWMTKQNKKKNK